MKIIILTQDPNNLSVCLIQEALEKELQKLSEQDELEEKVDICCIDLAYDIEILDEEKVLRVFSPASEVEPRLMVTEISLDEIAVVMLRTWGPPRYKGLSLCENLEKQGIYILNGCHFIQWSHSKIQQYNTLTLKSEDILPESLCYGREMVEALLDVSSRDQIIDEIQKAVQESALNYPIIFKTSQGTQASGVYRIDSQEGLKKRLTRFVTEIQTDDTLKKLERMDGFLIQTFVQTSKNSDEALYYRINVVNGQIQSAACYVYHWGDQEDQENQGDQLEYSVLQDKTTALDCPINPDELKIKDIQHFIKLIDYPLDVVGIDIVVDFYSKQYYLLETNNGPNVSDIVRLGNISAGSGHDACRVFPDKIAELTCSHLLARLNQVEEIKEMRCSV